MKVAEFQLEPLTCPTCVRKIEGALGKMDGIEDSRVLFNSSKVKLKLDESETKPEDVKERIEKLGFDVLSHKLS